MGFADVQVILIRLNGLLRYPKIRNANQYLPDVVSGVVAVCSQFERERALVYKVKIHRPQRPVRSALCVYW